MGDDFLSCYQIRPKVLCIIKKKLPHVNFYCSELRLLRIRYTFKIYCLVINHVVVGSYSYPNYIQISIILSCENFYTSQDTNFQNTLPRISLLAMCSGAYDWNLVVIGLPIVIFFSRRGAIHIACYFRNPIGIKLFLAYYPEYRRLG